MKNWNRLPTLVLSLLLHLTPLARVAVAESVVASSPFLAVLRLFAGSAAVAGAFHSVSGATGLTITQGGANVTSVNCTNGVQVAGYRFSIVSSIHGTAKSYTFKNLPAGLTGSLQGVLTGTPANGISGQFTPTITGWANSGGTGDNYSTTFLITEVLNPSTPVAQSISFAAPPTQTFGGAPLVLSATASSGLPVTFSVVSGPGSLSGNTLSFTAAGTVVIAANQSGNSSFSAAPTVTQSITVQKAAQSISFGALPTQILGGAPLVLSATSSSGLPVTFSVVSGPGSLSGNTLSFTAAGTVVLAANQSGDANYTAAGEVTQSVVVQGSSLQAQKITFPALASTNYTAGLTIPLKATASSGLPVDFNLQSGPGKITGTNLAVTGAGVIKVVASQVGNSVFAAADSVVIGLTVDKSSQAIEFSTAATTSLGDAIIPLTASSSASLPVSFRVLSGPGSIEGNQLQATGIGTISISADQPGDANYLAAPQVVRTILVVPGLSFQAALPGGNGSSLLIYLDAGTAAQVEETSDLATWTLLSSIRGAGPSTPINLPLSGGSATPLLKFWRVRVLP